MNFKTLHTLVDKKIEDSFITKDMSGTVSLSIYNSKIEYRSPYYVVKDKFGKVISPDLVSYDIAMLIAEVHQFSAAAAELDNSFSQYYNDILYLRNAYKTADDDKKAIINARFEETKIKLLFVLKVAKRTQWIMKHLDKYTK